MTKEQDVGRIGFADRAGALRAEPPAASQAEPLVPCAGAFTPGPWRYVGDGYVEAQGAPLRLRSAYYDYAYTDANDRKAEWDANARLIAAVPDLYEALEDAFYALTGLHIATGKKSDTAEAAIEKAVAALVKAGREQ